jgi:hypothetical protein
LAIKPKEPAPAAPPAPPAPAEPPAPADDEEEDGTVEDAISGMVERTAEILEAA